MPVPEQPTSPDSDDETPSLTEIPETGTSQTEAITEAKTEAPSKSSASQLPLEIITDLAAHLKSQGIELAPPRPPAQLKLEILDHGAGVSINPAAIAVEQANPASADASNPEVLDVELPANVSSAEAATQSEARSLHQAEAEGNTDPEGHTDPSEVEEDGDEAEENQAEILPGLTLTPEQQQALQTLEAFLDSGEKLHLLTGYAGTGKTTLLQALLLHLKERGDKRSIVFTALSNKATKVLATMADHWDLKVDCLTCCRLLGLKPTIDKETGQQKFTADRKGKRLINRYRLVVVDECSMINQEMWDLLVKAVSRLDDQTQLLFVGDEAQLPPVGETASPCFEQIYDRTDLTDVVRYGGAIGLLAEDVRCNLDRQLMPRWQSDRSEDNTQGTFILPPQQWDKLLLRAFTSESYSKSPDQVRVLAYTNRRVQQLNQRIRAAIYGPQAEQFVVGERLMANSPCLIDDNQIILQTSEECEVLDAYIDHVDDPVMLERWQVWKMDIVTEAGLYRELRVLHSQENKRFDKALKGLADSKSWKAFWELKQYFHALNYAYSLTVHKSQGSTFQDVFVDLPNLMINRKVTERNQLCYVAFTRAANRLFLYQ